MLKSIKIITVLTIATLGLIISVGGRLKAAPAQSTADFYKGKTVTVVCGELPGGATDLTTRTFTKYMGKAIGATLNVVTLTTGAKLEARHKVLDATPNGLTLGYEDFVSVLTDDLYDTEGVRYAVEKFGWIGGVGDETTIFAILQDSPLKTIQDVQKAKGVKLGSTSAAGMRTHNLAVVLYLLDMDDGRIITGLKGASGVELAMRQGEVLGTAIDVGSYKRGVANKIYNGLFTIDTRRSVGEPNIKALTEIMNLPKEKLQILELMLTARPSWAAFTTPGIPQDRLDYLRATFNKVSKLPEFKADIEKVWYAGIPFVEGKTYNERATSAKTQEKFWQEQFRKLLKKYVA